MLKSKVAVFSGFTKWNVKFIVSVDIRMISRRAQEIRHEHYGDL